MITLPIVKIIGMDKKLYMLRALQLARNGMGFASPNPMVGAVIVAPDGRIIGEGWHRVCGRWHAEVNAVATVAEQDRPLLAESTMFVTLEPCSHYGKTPPCSRLIIETGIPRVVVATVDPFSKVAGRGIAMLRKAGVEVEVGLLGEDSRALNRRFFTAHTQRRPFVTLKWARSADGYMDWKRDENYRQACRFSTRLVNVSTMRLRSLNDAVLTTARTAIADRARLTVRNWDGRQPVRAVLDRSGVLSHDEALFAGVEDVIVYGPGMASALADVLADLYENHSVTSVLVEAGPTLLGMFIGQGLWDVAREEIASFGLGSRGAVKAPELPATCMVSSQNWEGNTIRWFDNCFDK